MVGSAGLSPSPSRSARSQSWPHRAAWVLAGVASIAAGSIHAVAVGGHGEHRTMAILFVAAAAFQVAWGVAALRTPTRALAAAGVVGHGALAGFWLVTRITSVGFIAGLEQSEAVGFGDGVAAALAVVAAGSAAVALARSPHAADGETAGARRPTGSLVYRAGVAAPVVAALVALPAMYSAGTTDHSHGGDHHGDSHDSGVELAVGVGDDHTDHDGDDDHDDDHIGHDAGDDDDHTDHDGDDHADHDGDDHAEAGGEHDDDDAAHDGHAHDDDGGKDPADHGDGEVAAGSSSVAPAVYDPELPIDLSGVDGVTPQQQARAENLIAITLDRLPRYTDPAVAEADGFRSIHDGFTGYEHYMNWDYVNDEHILNPDYPESLVYQVQGDGTKQLVSAMFMAPDGETLDTVPDVGGKLTQWHIHNDLCFAQDPYENDGETSVIGLTVTAPVAAA